MVDQTIGVTNQSTAGVSSVDVSQVTTQTGVIVERQRIVIADGNNPNQFMDLDMLLSQRRQIEAQVQWARDAETIAATVTRFCARMPVSDSRGRFDRGYR